ncbi:ABC-2 type transport system ATP-binding protein [Paraburkholderia atlantica]|uniref:ABC transporter ATP-binding protein n=1 Tax=Paraburkholderia atlantica TaxID=2654982 RepID=UPI003D20FBFB
MSAPAPPPANASDPVYAIDVHGLNKHFGTKHVVNDVTMQVQRGEIFGFLGPNGSGKTTCIRMMCGLLTPDSGSGTCLGYDIVQDSAQIKRRTGYMTQRFSYWEDLSIRENLDFVARIYEMKNRREAVDRALEQLGLQSRAKQLAGALSGGWKQRLALAACMLHEPQLLLLDEPTAGVDPSARRDFWEELHRLAARGISVLVSTHYMDEAERCHKLAYIAYGKLLAQGTSKQVIDSQGLVTWAVYGQNLVELGDRLRSSPGVEQTVAFGSSLHVSGPDTPELHASIDQLERSNPTLRIERQETGLEDVFIFMMNRSTDNYATPSAGTAS